MKKLVLSLLLITVPWQAWAWGDREQGILAGIAGVWVFNKLSEANHQAPRPVIHQRPVVVHQQPQYQYYSCIVEVREDHTGIIRYEQRTCVR